MSKKISVKIRKPFFNSLSFSLGEEAPQARLRFSPTEKWVACLSDPFLTTDGGGHIATGEGRGLDATSMASKCTSQ